MKVRENRRMDNTEIPATFDTIHRTKANKETTTETQQTKRMRKRKPPPKTGG
jgi:hypothetical protein